MVTGADAEAVDAVIGVWPAGRAAVGSGEPDPAEPDTVPDTVEPVSDGWDGGGVVELVAIAVTRPRRCAARSTPTPEQAHLLAAATHREALVLGRVEDWREVR